MKRHLTQFSALPVGARFEFRGRRYEKLALSLARDEDCCGNVFQDQTEVWADLPPPPRVLDPRRQPARPWTEHLCPAPQPAPTRRAPHEHALGTV